MKMVPTKVIKISAIKYNKIDRMDGFVVSLS